MSNQTMVVTKDRAPARALRPDQSRTLRDLRRAMQASGRVAYVEFMGAGKTVVLAALAREWAGAGRRVLVLVHRGILLKQAKAQLVAAGVRESEIGVTWANHAGINLDAPIQVATVQTLARREAPKDVGLVIIDEGHHAPMATYQRVFKWFPDAKHLLVTATPEHNGRPLHDHADTLMLGARVEDLIADGILVKPECWTWPDGWTPKELRKSASDGDYTRASAEHSMSFVLGKIPDEWRRVTGGVPATLGIAVSKLQAWRLRDECLAAGIPSETLLEDDKDDARDAKLGRLKSGETKILWTCDVLSEGWDYDGCRCLIMAAPTCSTKRYLQWAGRVMRRGSKSWILDHAGNYVRFEPPWVEREWTLDAVPPVVPRNVEVTREGQVRHLPTPVSDVALVQATAVVWQTVCAGWPEECPEKRVPPRRAFQSDHVARREGGPWRCVWCAARKGRAAMTPEQRSEASRKANAAMTPERRSEASRKAQAAKTPEQRHEAARKRQAAMTPEQRSEWARKANAAKTPERRSEASRKAQAAKTQLMWGGS